MRRPSGALESLLALLMGCAASLLPACRSADIGILPRARLKPDIVSSVAFDPARLKRIGVLPFNEEGMQWEEGLPGSDASESEADVAWRFSERIARLSELEVVTPDRMRAFFAPEMLEISTRNQVVGICREMGLDGLFRGRSAVGVEWASGAGGAVEIPFVFFSLEVEFLEGWKGETVWFAKQHINSFQFLEDPLGIDLQNVQAAEEELAERIPGYPDPDRTLTVLGELAIAEVAEGFRKNFDSSAGDKSISP